MTDEEIWDEICEIQIAFWSSKDPYEVPYAIPDGGPSITAADIAEGFRTREGRAYEIFGKLLKLGADEIGLETVLQMFKEVGDSNELSEDYPEAE
jgi:hypothetical protein